MFRFSKQHVPLRGQGIVRAIRDYQVPLKEHEVTIFVRRGGPNYQEGLRVMGEVGVYLKTIVRVRECMLMHQRLLMHKRESEGYDTLVAKVSLSQPKASEFDSPHAFSLTVDVLFSRLRLFF